MDELTNYQYAVDAQAQRSSPDVDEKFSFEEAYSIPAVGQVCYAAAGILRLVQLV